MMVPARSRSEANRLRCVVTGGENGGDECVHICGRNGTNVEHERAVAYPADDGRSAGAKPTRPVLRLSHESDCEAWQLRTGKRARTYRADAVNDLTPCAGSGQRIVD